jgi:putative transposase
MVQALGRRYVAGFNRRHGRRGALWAGRYRAAVVAPGDWTLAAMLMVDRMALAGLAGSAGPHQGHRRDPLLAEAPERWALGNTPFDRDSAWARRLAAAPDAAVEQALQRAVQGSRVAGPPSFIAAVGQALGRPVAPRRRGRPPRNAVRA